MTPLDIALSYIKRGWSPIPVPYRKKAPILENWQTLRITADTAAEHFNGAPQNIGVLLGEPSGWLIDLDFDWQEVARLAPHFLPSTLLFGRPSNPRSHALVIALGARTRKFQLASDGGGMLLEIRGTGHQTVFPGSVHEGSGELTSFDNEVEPALIGADELEARCGKLAAASLLLRHWVPGTRDELAAATCGVLLRGGWEPSAVDGFIGIVSREAGDHNTQAKLKAERMQRALESKGHVPGIPKLKELLGDPAATKFAEWLGLRDDAVKPFPTSLVMSVSDFVARDIPPREWVVEGLLTTQALAMIYGWRGCGKTWLGLNLGVAIGHSEAFLNWHCSKKRRVLYIDGEMPAADLQRRASQMCGKRKDVLLDLLSSEFFYRSERHGFLLNSTEHQQRFLGLLVALEQEPRRPDVLIFDNLSSMSFGVEENDNSAMDSLLAFLMELRHLGYTVVVMHHAGKAGDQRGASRREDLLDTVIKLDKPGAASPVGNAKFKLVVTKARGTRTPTPIECELITDQDGFPAWAMRELGGAGEKPTWLRMLKFILDNRPANAQAVSTAFGLNKSNGSRHLARARAMGLLEPTGVTLTKKGVTYVNTTFAAAEEDEPEF